MKQPRALFLHGGPGFSCSVERAMFGETLPVIWWDQPTVAAHGICGFEDLLDAALVRLHEEAGASGGSISVLASSFGAHLALRLAIRVPDLISSLTLLGPTLDVPAGFVNMAKALSTKSSGESITEALKAFAELGTVETLWRLIDACATAPNYLQSLWGPGGQRAYELMLEIATKRPLIDVTTFQVVLDDFLRHVPKSFQLDFRKPIKVLQGRCDPYLGSSSRIEPWMGINPAIEVAVVDTGHFPHLELPPERWLAHAALPHSL